MRQCELCDQAARMYCESDEASLCWDCDAKVHGANFLVARHSRRLLCRSCQRPTPWRAEGARLSPTVSVCERCDAGRSKVSGAAGDEEVEAGGERRGGKEEDTDDENEGDREEEGEEEEEEEEEEEDEDEDDEEDEEDDDEEDEEEDVVEVEEGENQVVPWTLTPPPATSSSSEGEDLVRDDSGGSTKEIQENENLASSQRDSRKISPIPPLTRATSD